MKKSGVKVSSVSGGNSPKIMNRGGFAAFDMLFKFVLVSDMVKRLGYGELSFTKTSPLEIRNVIEKHVFKESIDKKAGLNE